METERSIVLKVKLDENHRPEKMTWSATDNDAHDKPCKAFLLSVWDPEEMSSLRIDLWTNEMRIDEMNKLFHQTLITMADTLKRSTSNDALALELSDFGKHFGQKAGITT